MAQFDEDFDPPERLRQALKAIYGPARGMDEIHDKEILAAARRAGEAAFSRRQHWRWMGAAGMAAAVALAAGILWRQLGAGHMAAPAAPAYARTGDIRDAFYLARQIKAAETGGKPVPMSLEGTWDTNGDRVIDTHDVQMLAHAAVKVSGGAEKAVMP